MLSWDKKKKTPPIASTHREQSAVWLLSLCVCVFVCLFVVVVFFLLSSTTFGLETRREVAPLSRRGWQNAQCRRELKLIATVGFGREMTGIKKRLFQFFEI